MMTRSFVSEKPLIKQTYNVPSSLSILALNNLEKHERKLLIYKNLNVIIFVTQAILFSTIIVLKLKLFWV